MIIALVPAYNEAKTIQNVVNDLRAAVDVVVVIDDGSGDDTGLLAHKAGAVVIRHSLNRGQGAALETGHEYARQNNADFVVHFDADGQMRAGDIPAAIAELNKKKCDIILGTRKIQNSSIPFLKRFFIFPIARFTNRLFGSVALTDAHNGFRILNRRALEVIRLKQDGMAHATEIPQLIRRHNLSYAEFPVEILYREFGQGPIGGVKVVRDLLIGKFV